VGWVTRAYAVTRRLSFICNVSRWVSRRRSTHLQARQHAGAIREFQFLE